MVFCIGAEYADVVQVLVAVEWWSVVVSTGHVSSFVYAGVAGAGLGVIVITEFELYSNRTMGFLSRFLEEMVGWWCELVAAQAGWGRSGCWADLGSRCTIATV